MHADELYALSIAILALIVGIAMIVVMIIDQRHSTALTRHQLAGAGLGKNRGAGSAR